MLAVGLLVFDWYFFFVVDRLLSTLRPIVAVLHRVSGDRRARALPGTSVQQRSGDRSVPLEQPSAWPIGTNAGSIIQNLKPVVIDQEFTKMNTNIEQFSYVSKLVALTHLYMELSLPVPVALQAAEADLR
jgi:hypothetical protein